MSQTFATQLEARNSTGFDYLRIALAVSVVVWHSFEVSYDQATIEQLNLNRAWIAVGFVLPSFFALSGFLVAGSLERSKTLAGFASLRALRIVPALAVEILLSALILGPMLTTLSLSEYFSDPKFFHYFENILGIIHFELPGLFESNPQPGIVNKSLWTVPYELHCYLWLIGFAAFGITKRRRLFLTLVILLMIALPLSHLRSGVFFRPMSNVPHRVLEISFLAGVCLYLYRDMISRSRSLLAAASVLSVITLSHPSLQYFSPFPVAYVTVWLGLTRPRVLGILRKGDYSYGVYLFAFPIQQVIAMAPWAREWWINSALTLPLCFAYAVFSWHCVEEPILMRKKSVVSLVDKIVSSVNSLIKRTVQRIRKREPGSAL